MSIFIKFYCLLDKMETDDLSIRSSLMITKYNSNLNNNSNCKPTIESKALENSVGGGLYHV